MTYQRQSIDDLAAWDGVIRQLPNAHLLQSAEWGEFKSLYGWQAARLVWSASAGPTLAAAQVLKRNIAPAFSLIYCPRGPLLDWRDQKLLRFVLADLKRFSRAWGATFLKIEPGVSVENSNGDPGAAAQPDPILRTIADNGYIPSGEAVQFKNTMVLDLTKAEDDLLADMKQKTRYNIRLAARKGVRISLGGPEDFETLYRMYAETSLRDGFTIRSSDYYQDVWKQFHYAGIAQPFLAIAEGRPVAGAIVYRFGETAWFLYGMSRDLDREKMPNYLLQWEAIRWAKAVGCDTYDFWGAPDTLDEADPLWGVFRFKQGFGAKLVQTPGAWDAILKPVRYRLYQQVRPRILAWMRRRGQAQTQQALD